ncbi:hypothetical protein ACWED2_46845 [Amycolatopsis sp. NPDC005003]
MESPVRRFLPPVLSALAAGLTVAGTFLPLLHLEQPTGAPSEVITWVIGAWRTRFRFPGQDEVDSPSSPVGAPLLLGAAILLVAAVLGIRKRGRAAGLTTLGGAAFLLGAVCTAGVQAATRLFEDDPVEAETTLGAGLWLLIAAVLVAAAAAALSFRASGGTPDWADPTVAYADTETPPSGVVITVLPPERD